MGKFLFPYDFVVLDMDEDFATPLILGRPFLVTAGIVIDVQTDTMSFTYVGRGWISVSLLPHRLQRLLSLIHI